MMQLGGKWSGMFFVIIVCFENAYIGPLQGPYRLYLYSDTVIQCIQIYFNIYIVKSEESIVNPLVFVWPFDSRHIYIYIFYPFYII